MTKLGRILLRLINILLISVPFVVLAMYYMAKEYGPITLVLT
jgi:hypothetical protein